MTWICIFLFLLVVLIVWGFKMSRGHRKPLGIFPSDYGLVSQTVHFPTQDGLTLRGGLFQTAQARRSLFWCTVLI